MCQKMDNAVQHHGVQGLERWGESCAGQRISGDLALSPQPKMLWISMLNIQLHDHPNPHPFT